MHRRYATAADFRSALSGALKTTDLGAEESSSIQHWFDLTLAKGYEVELVPSAGEASPCPGDSGSPLLRADSEGKLQVYGVKQRPAGFEPASRLCAFGAVYALFQNQAARDFLVSFGLLAQTAPDADPESACARCNGDWAVHGLDPTPGCNCRTLDAGRPCTATSQCEGACLLDSREVIEVQPGPPRLGYFSGSCAEFVASYGCRSVAPAQQQLLDLDEPPPTLCRD